MDPCNETAWMTALHSNFAQLGVQDPQLLRLGLLAELWTPPPG
jgi:hypothetical protein